MSALDFLDLEAIVDNEEEEEEFEEEQFGEFIARFSTLTYLNCL